MILRIMSRKQNLVFLYVPDRRYTIIDWMYICMVEHLARVWTNRVRLPILHVVSSRGKTNISLSAFAPENLVLRDGFGSPVPRQPAHLRTQAESVKRRSVLTARHRLLVQR